MSPKLLPLLLLPLILTVAGCSPEREPGELFGPSESDVIVVDASLIVGRSLPFVYLSRTVEPDQAWTEVKSPELGAMVTIAGDDGVVAYEPDPVVRGRYRPEEPGTRVKASSRYHLSVITSRGERVVATTTTPPPFQVSGWLVLEDDLSIRQDLQGFPDLGPRGWTSGGAIRSSRGPGVPGGDTQPRSRLGLCHRSRLL